VHFSTFVAGIARQVLSFVSLCPMSAISAMSDVAYFAAQTRFSAASVEGSVDASLGVGYGDWFV